MAARIATFAEALEKLQIYQNTLEETQFFESATFKESEDEHGVVLSDDDLQILAKNIKQAEEDPTERVKDYDYVALAFPSGVGHAGVSLQESRGKELKSRVRSEFLAYNLAKASLLQGICDLQRDAPNTQRC